MKKIWKGIGIAAAILLVILVIRTGERARPRGENAAAIRPVEFDREAAVERYADALRLPTISHGADSGVARDDAAFAAFRQLMEDHYPRVHASLHRELVAGHTMVYTWPGRDEALDPIILMGHYDVVPVDPAAIDRWTHPPFAGTVADGFFWGRGAIDDKINVVAQLEAVEALLDRGFAPDRTVILSFGHDEELGGPQGATRVVRLLAERGVRALLVLDEGGAIAKEGGFPGLAFPIAALGIAEKGYLSVEMVVETAGGHSSAPPQHTAVGILATAIHKLERNPMPSHFGGVMELTLDALGPQMDFGYRLAMKNLWLFGPVIEQALNRIPRISPMLRTTTAATIFRAGVKDNVLPNKATAVVNFRIFPGDSIDSVVAHVRRVVDDDRDALTPRAKQREPSGVTAIDTPAFELLTRSIAQVFPDAIPAPFLIPGGTDARYFREISDGTFGFSPVMANVSDLTRAHGNDERLAVDAYLRAIEFYAQLIQNASAQR